MHRDKAPKIVWLWITWWTMWITCRKKCGQSRCIPCIKATGSHFVHPLARREEGLFFCSFSFCERKRTKKKAQESAPAIPPRPPVSGACLPRKNILRSFSFRKAPQGKSVLFSFRRKKREPEKKAGNPPGLARRARPSAERTFPAKNILRGFSSFFFFL